MSEWKETILGNEVELITGFPFKSSQYTNNENDIKLLRGDNIVQGKLRWSDVKRWTKEDSLIDSKYSLREGDVVLAMDRPWIEAGLKYSVISYHDLPCLLVQRVSCLRGKTSLENSFLRYIIGSSEFTNHVRAVETGTAVPHISGSQINEFPFVLPPLPEQRAIASVLSSLDYKIDLLHRQNKTLEALVETLFRQWFVVEANKGWENCPLSSVANFLNGLACQKYPPKNDLEKLPVLKIKELSGGISESSDWASTAVKSEYVVQAGDVIFAWSASLMVKVWDGEKCILNQHLFKVTSGVFPKWFYLGWCKHHLAEFISISSSHATTMGHIKRGDLDTAIVLVPSKIELDAMSEQMIPLLDKQIAIAKQIRTLEKLRNTLLPKLMSGEVRVAQ
jgi:Restriction endonuclease S subunits